MFTGIVEEIGTVAEVQPDGNGRSFHIHCAAVLEGLQPGDSVSVDGACHTVTAARADGFSMQSVATTLERTTVGGFRIGHRVNLERAVSLSTRLGGHLVQGHVDAVAQVKRIVPREEHVLIDITLPSDAAQVTILHGSLAINGVSLTVNALPESGIAQVSIIPYTLKHTTLGDLTEGDGVNLETDLIGKYVRRLLSSPASADLRATWGY
ncbi:MAG TPA: riboflavin synthase [Longimicrobiaceae bacterium]|nr:riboflavin synthase [Longimicrobiaceae bacterium]